jgi:hypothetical protein
LRGRGRPGILPRREGATIEDRLIFLVSPPRSGSTLLARMLGAHSAIAGGPEAHLLTPLAHLGYYERVDAAPYDPVISQEGIRELVARLPRGEADYLAACRAYADSLYTTFLSTRAGRSRVLDKTPAYALSLPFIAKLYPGARYVVLTRTPLAVLSSQAHSFFDGRFEDAVRQSPVLERYVPAIARFLEERAVPLFHVRYEDLVQDPERRMRELTTFLELPFEPAMLEYGRGGEDGAPATGARGLGDPTGVRRHDRPVTSSVERWATDIAGDPEARRVAAEQLDLLDPRDVKIWGYDLAEIRAMLERATPSDAPAARPLTRYRLERKVLVQARRAVRKVPLLERLLRRVRLYCDVLLR